MAKLDSIMSTSVIRLSPHDSIQTLVSRLSKGSDSCAIIEDNGLLIGIVTTTDIVRIFCSKKMKLSDPVFSIMSSPVTIIDKQASLEQANKIMDTKTFGNYPIVETERVVGIVTHNNVVQAINDNMRFHRHLQNAVLGLFLIYALGIICYYILL